MPKASNQFASPVLGYVDTRVADDSVRKLDIDEDLAHVKDWLTTHKLTLNVSKTKFMIIAGRQRLARVEEIELLVNEDTMEQTDSFKYLGIKLNQKMKWSDHIDYIQSKVAKRLGLLKSVKHFLPVRSREIMYNTTIQPILDYGDIVWGTVSMKSK